MDIEISQKQHQDLRAFFRLFSRSSGEMECFFKKPEGPTATRFFSQDEEERFIQETVLFNSQGYTCYVGIQPRHERLKNVKKSGENSDVAAIRFLYLDGDPLSPDGMNATEEERQACYQSMKIIQQRFVAMGYQEPLFVSSGNGFWLFVPIPEIHLTEDNRSEMAARLKAWGEKARSLFRAEGVKLDTVFDLRRITKIPGTRVFNHPHTDERPQRIAEIVSAGLPEADMLLRQHFLGLPITIEEHEHQKKKGPRAPYASERIFERCYLMRFIRDKSSSGVNLPHSIRLALSTFSLALGDLENDLAFIRQVIGGCPDFNEEKTRHYIKMNAGKSSPYGCEKLRSLAQEHFEDFRADECNCNLAPSFDVSTGTVRKPSPVRFAYPMEEDLDELCKELQLSTDSFNRFSQLKNFTHQNLTSFDHITSKRFLESKKKIWHLKNDDIKDLLKYRQEILNAAQKKIPTTEIPAEIKEKALALLKRSSLLYDYTRAVQGLGLVNEDKNIGILLLTLTSRLLDTIINLIIKGESSAGKSYLLKKCLEVFPEELFHEFTSMSSRALIYTEKDFQHKFVIIYEFDGQNDEMNYLIRTLQSEGRLKYEYTVKNKNDGNFMTCCIDKEGPTGFITTTTKAETFDENETRLFSLYIDESEHQTKEILKRLGTRFENNGRFALNEEIEIWKTVQRLLKPYPVIIPYASWIADQIPAGKIRVRRDFERVMLTISVCALLHQYQRTKVTIGETEYVQASVADYLMVRELLEGTLIQTVNNQSPKTQRILETIIRIYEQKQEKSEGGDFVKEGSEGTDTADMKKGLVTMNDLVQEMSSSRKTIHTWLAPAVNDGYVERVSEGRYNTKYYRPTEKAYQFMGAGQTFLPTPEKLLNAFPGLSRGLRYVNPVTGEETVIEDDGR